MRSPYNEVRIRAALRTMMRNSAGMMFYNDTPVAALLIRRGLASRIEAPRWAKRAGMARGYRRLWITDKGRDWLKAEAKRDD